MQVNKEKKNISKLEILSSRTQIKSTIVGRISSGTKSPFLPLEEAKGEPFPRPKQPRRRITPLWRRKQLRHSGFGTKPPFPQNAHQTLQKKQQQEKGWEKEGHDDSPKQNLEATGAAQTEKLRIPPRSTTRCLRARSPSAASRVRVVGSVGRLDLVQAVKVSDVQLTLDLSDFLKSNDSCWHRFTDCLEEIPLYFRAFGLR